MLQIVFGKVVLVASLAVDRPLGEWLRVNIKFAKAVDYDVGMDVACSVIAICMGADQSLMPRKISFCVSTKSIVPGTVRAAAEQAENFLNGTRLTASMVSAFIENVFVYDGGRIVVRFKYEQSIQDAVKALHTG